MPDMRYQYLPEALVQKSGICNISHQLEEDRAVDQMTLDLGDPFNGKK